MNRTLPFDVRVHTLLRAQAGDKYENMVEVACEFDRKVLKGSITKIRDKYEETKSLIDKHRLGHPTCEIQRKKKSL